MMTRVGDVGQPRQRARPLRQHVGDQPRLLIRQHLLPWLGHLPQVHRAQPPAGAIGDRERRRGRLAVGVVAPDRYEYPVRPAASTGWRVPRDASAGSNQARTHATCAAWACGAIPCHVSAITARSVSTDQATPRSRFRSARTVSWVVSVAAWATHSARAGVARPAAPAPGGSPGGRSRARRRGGAGRGSATG